ncbi:MAG: hypothetical protein GH142_00240, partial [Dehalococcoidia bacterium]|nr:hypothetical protein [Dehalococcoidia bacterium]
MSLYAAAPVMTSATYDEYTNVLTVKFDSAVRTQEVLFGRLIFDDDAGGPGEDFVLSGGTTLNADTLTDSLSISLLFESQIDKRFVKLYGVNLTVYFWGVNTVNVDDLEKMNTSDLQLIADEDAFLDAGFEPNNKQVISVNVVSSGSAPQITDAIYDANVNKLHLVFDQIVQFDQAAEDRSIDGGPGNGILDPKIGENDPGEDINGNDSLDTEPNFDVFKISLSDGDGNVVALDGYRSIDQVADNDTISIALTYGHSRKVETSLNPASIQVDLGQGAFKDTLYNLALAGSAAATVVPDSLPLFPDSVFYHVNDNDLRVRFRSAVPGNRPLNIADTPPVYTKFKFRLGTQEVTLTGIDGNPATAGDGCDLQFKELLAEDQKNLEQLIGSMGPADTLYFSLGGYAVFDDLETANIPVTLIIDDEAPQPPKLVREGLFYDAGDNTLHIGWDLDIGTYNFSTVPNGLPESEVDLAGFYLHDTIDDTDFTFTSGKLYYLNNRKEILVQLGENDQIRLESDAHKSNMVLVIEPFVFIDFRKNNGNLAVTVDSGFTVTYIPDITAAVLDTARYDHTAGVLDLVWDEPVVVSDLNVGKLSFSGVTLEGTVRGSDTLTFASILSVEIASSVVSSLEDLADAVKTDPILYIQAAAYTNIEGLSNDLDTLAAGYGRYFWITSFE